MATWEDGPEYAPLERPAEFSTPVAKPLDAGPPPAAPPPATPRLPVDRPGFTGPAVPLAPLDTLVPVRTDVRDPGVPFEVVASNLTSGSAWGAAHQSAALAAAPPTPAAWPAPAAPAAPSAPQPNPAAPWPASSESWPAPAEPPPPLATQPAPAGFPAPGTPQWFGPGPYGEQPAPPRVDARAVLDAATPGLLLVLGIGAVVFVLSPVLLVVAFALSRQVKVAQQAVRRALGISLAAVGFVGLVGLTRDLFGFGEWWSFVGLWSLLLCWGMLGTVSALVYRGLTAAASPPSRDLWR